MKKHTKVGLAKLQTFSVVLPKILFCKYLLKPLQNKKGQKKFGVPDKKAVLL